MHVQISRETADMILAAHNAGMPMWDIRKAYSVSNALISRIVSGKWFKEQDARDAKIRKKRPRGIGWCEACAARVRLPCLACKIRKRAKGRRPRYSEKSLHAEVQADGTCKITRTPPPLGYQLTRDEEEARQEVRAGLFEGKDK
jgi:NAD(P)H-nitrite reductase large subunit